MQSPKPQPPPLESIALQGGASIAESILARVDEFPKRENVLNSWMKHELESVPTQILWHGLEEEAAPVFVVYKLIHESLSNSPSFFRRFISSLMAAQPERFSTVFSREASPNVRLRSWFSRSCHRDPAALHQTPRLFRLHRREKQERLSEGARSKSEQDTD
jgi:hypothetical protein